MARTPNYTPREAVTAQNRVKIALGNGKVFQAGVVDVFNNGEKLHIVRIINNRIVRREVLNFGYGFGDIKAISVVGCNNLLKGTNGDLCLPPSSGKYTTKNPDSIITILRPKENKEILNFKRDQEKYFNSRSRDLEQLNQKIARCERNDIHYV